MPEPAPTVEDHPALIRVLAAACGLSVANLYYNQPLLADMARSLHVSQAAIGVVPTLTQIGYALGMLFLVPLGDVVHRRRLIVTLLLLVAVSVVAAAVAPTLALLAAASLAIGVTTCVPQILVPVAAQLTPPENRGKAIGVVMMGLLLGILLSRTLAGFVGEHFGWRAVYWMAAGLMVALAAVVGPLLPAQDPPAEISYGELLRSVYTLARTKPVVRQSMLNGALLFACFSAFWATLSFRLETPPLHYGTRVAGLFGVVAAVGALAAPLAGRITDRTGPRVLLTAATASILASFVLFWLTGHTLLGLAAGVILLDVGMQTAQVTNMTRNYAVAASTPSRVNSAYMVAYFVGGSLGSLGATQAWRWAGWSGVCALACGLSAVALFAHLFAEPAGADGVTNLPGATAPSPARA